MDAARLAGAQARRRGRRAFDAAGLDTGILGYDHNWSTHPDDVASTPPGEDPETDYPYRLLGSPEADAFDGIAYHCYAGDPADQTKLHDAFPDTELWFTECSGSHGASDPPAQYFSDTLKWHARNLVMGVTRNWSSTVVNWNLALDPTGGPHNGGCDTCTGVVTVGAKNTVTRNAEYYTLGHLARFVDPGAVRIASTSYGTTSWNGKVMSVAFRNPDGSIVLVAHNENDEPSDIGVAQGDQSFDYTLPGGSLATFVWDDSAALDDGYDLVDLGDATATSTTNGTGTANAVDDDGSTAWTSGAAQQPGQELTVDLGAPVDVRKVVLDAGFTTADPAQWWTPGIPSTDYPRGVRLLTSTDGTTWTEVSSAQGDRPADDAVGGRLAGAVAAPRADRRQRLVVVGGRPPRPHLSSAAPPAAGYGGGGAQRGGGRRPARSAGWPRSSQRATGNVADGRRPVRRGGGARRRGGRDRRQPGDPRPRPDRPRGGRRDPRRRAVAGHPRPDRYDAGQLLRTVPAVPVGRAVGPGRRGGLRGRPGRRGARRLRRPGLLRALRPAARHLAAAGAPGARWPRDRTLRGLAGQGGPCRVLRSPAAPGRDGDVAGPPAGPPASARCPAPTRTRPRPSSPARSPTCRTSSSCPARGARRRPGRPHRGAAHRPARRPAAVGLAAGRPAGHRRAARRSPTSRTTSTSSRRPTRAAPARSRCRSAARGPLAAALRLTRGEPVLSDPGAVRDLAQSLTDGAVAAPERRTPSAAATRRSSCSSTSPRCPAVLAGGIRSSSGARSFRPVPAATVEETLRALVDAVGVPVVVHCCAERPPVAALVRAPGRAALSLDLTVARPGGRRRARRGGRRRRPRCSPGVVPAAPERAGRLSDPAGTVEPVRRVWRRLGLPAESLRRVVVTPTCGLAGASPDHARAALRLAADAARQLAEDPEG